MSPRVLILAIILGVLLWLLFVLSIAHQGFSAAPAVMVVEPDPWTTTTTVTLPDPPTTQRPEVPRKQTTAPISGGAIAIASTGYCETGHMANGQPAHDGAVSSHVLKRGTRWRVLDGLYAGNVYTVEDTGPLATFDIAMPGRCAEAIDYGRRYIHIEAA